MPKSRIRQKAAFTPPPTKLPAKLRRPRAWVPWVMCGFFLIGLLWIVTYYVTSTKYPMEAWGNWNIVVGFSGIAAGFAISTQWK